MPKGDIRLKNGISVHYDDVRKVGDHYVIKRAYSHDVQSVHKSEVDSVLENEWHQTPFGYCKKLSESEIRNARKKDC